MFRQEINEKLDTIIKAHADTNVKVTEIDEVLLGTYDKKGLVSRVRGLERTNKVLLTALGAVSTPVVIQMIMLVLAL